MKTNSNQAFKKVLSALAVFTTWLNSITEIHAVRERSCWSTGHHCICTCGIMYRCGEMVTNMLPSLPTLHKPQGFSWGTLPNRQRRKCHFGVLAFFARPRGVWCLVLTSTGRGSKRNFLKNSFLELWHMMTALPEQHKHNEVRSWTGTWWLLYLNNMNTMRSGHEQAHDCFTWTTQTQWSQVMNRHMMTALPEQHKHNEVRSWTGTWWLLYLNNTNTMKSGHEKAHDDCFTWTTQTQWGQVMNRHMMTALPEQHGEVRSCTGTYHWLTIIFTVDHRLW